MTVTPDRKHNPTVRSRTGKAVGCFLHATSFQDVSSSPTEMSKTNELSNKMPQEFCSLTNCKRSPKQAAR